jgi:protease-4
MLVVYYKNTLILTPFDINSKTMKNFFTYLLATIVGIFISALLFLFLSIGIISVIVSSQEKSVEIKPNTVLLLKLDQPIVDRKPVVPFNLGNLSPTQKMGLNVLLRNIKKAKNDNNIAGIHLDISVIPSGIGTIEEIRNALLDFRESGKFVTVHSSILSQGAYYLASAADEIYLNPVGFMEWVGLRAQSPFFKHTLEKLDVEATVVRYGKYKSYAESFTESGYSPENREQLKKLVSEIWETICDDISTQRNITSARLNEIADKLLVRNPQSAYELGLVDSLVYDEEVLSILKNKTGIDSSKELRTVELADYNRVSAHREYKGLAKDKIAVIYASGDIVNGEGDDQTIGDKKFIDAIQKARKDSSIKAIVLRVNSPGGSAFAAENIWHELELAKAVKPLVVSMGDMAASGGYYISCIADTIVAQPTTITGSIGVIGLYFNMKGLFNKFGVTFDTEKTNAYSDFLSGLRPASKYELNYWQDFVDSIYTTFVKRVDKGRELNFDQIDKIGQGRIWSGTDALEIGLVDKLGNLNDAIEIARNMAGLDEKYRIVELPKQEDPLEKLLKNLSQGVSQRSIKKQLGQYSEYYLFLDRIIKSQGILARMPYDISIY